MSDEQSLSIMEVENSDQHGLAIRAAEWRRRALRGDRDARGIAHTLEVEVRRLRGSAPAINHELDTRPLAVWAAARPWWKRW